MSKNSLDDLFKIQCGSCGAASPVDDWTQTAINGPLEHGVYQCPKCALAFRRQARVVRNPWEPYIELVAVDSRL